MTRSSESTNRVTIYTDGGCRPNPGPGGWGAVLELPDGGRRELSGSDPESTNNRMELTAALRALEAVPPGTDVELVTDSTYLEQGITRWLPSWRRRGWVTTSKEPVKNRDLWMALDEVARKHRINWQWARGHAGHAGNERAHELAAAAIPGDKQERAGAAPLAEPGADAVEALLAVAWSAKSRQGAWGALLRYRGVEKEIGGRARVASANAAHIASAALALEAIQKQLPVRVVTVSDYLRDGATLWLPAWRQRGWKTREGKPVANREWWERLARQLARLRVTWQVVAEDPPPAEIVRARELARRALAAE